MNVDEYGNPIQTPNLKAMGWGGWNENNIFDDWDLNPLASTIGGGANGVRDTLSEERDAYLQPLMTDYRNRVGEAASADDDQTLYLDDNFRDFVRSGGDINTGAAGSGAKATQDQLNEILAALRGMNAQPDVSPEQLDTAALNMPEFTVPGENLGPSIDQTLLEGMDGSDPLGLQALLQSLLQRSTPGEGGVSPQLLNRMNQARETLTRGQEGALADVRGVLADRGLISVPGSPEGSELDATTRAFQPLQRDYLDQLRTAQNDEFDREDANQKDALSIATGWTQDEAARRLASAGSASQRQQMLSEIALSVLDKNMEWNQFLATFGLQREQVAAAIQQGKVDSLMPAIQMFLSLISQSRGGYV